MVGMYRQDALIALPSGVASEEAEMVHEPEPPGVRKTPRKRGLSKVWKLSTGVSVLSPCGDRAGRVACRG